VLILSSAPSANDPPAASMVNQPPVAAISMAPLSGTVPLTVVLDASASTDSDGSISSYTWNFGDGSSGSGKTVQNIYTETAEFTITLTVVDNEGASSTATKNLSTIPAELYFEVMELELTHEWQRVVFDQQFTDPIVAGGPPSFNETDPTTIRVRNVDSSGLDIRLQEWDYQDGTHLGELVNLLVMERGDYILADGAQIEADSFVSTTDFGSVDLRQQYEESPVILTQVVTENEEEAVVGRLKSIGSSSFEFKLQEREQEAESHAGETVGYIAWQRGNGSILGLSYDADVVENSVNAEWSEVAFLEQFGEAPLVMAKIQTYVSGDTAALRKQNSSKTSVELKVEEETGGDEEVEHSGEAVGYIAIGVK
ncbi:MAG: PKD domain-containing protein, partial [Desulfobulbaceae bacterium]|nr:PKD domain-containing protein [Desulfobulbaceae bacterium]